MSLVTHLSTIFLGMFSSIHGTWGCMVVRLVEALLLQARRLWVQFLMGSLDFSLT